MSTRTTTPAERSAAAASGRPEAKGLSKEGPQDQDRDVLSIVELAALYIGTGGADPRAQKVFDAGVKAGHIDASGKYVGPPANGDKKPHDDMLAQGADMSDIDALLASIADDDDAD